MLEIKTGRLGMSGRTWFVCNHCKTGSVYFLTPPEKCESCMKSLPHLNEIRCNMQKRIQFYRKRK